MKSYIPDQVMNGTEGEAWLDDEYMAEVIALEAKFKLTKSDVTQTKRWQKGSKVTGIEGTGTIKFNKVSSYMLSILLESARQRKFPRFTIISNWDDPSAIGNERIRLTGVMFDEITIADWEAGKMGEESYPFTFETAELLDAALA